MDANQNLVDMQMERYEVFKAQDSESDEFDVAFSFNGKKLYASKYMLSSISSTFKSMLSGRWNKSAEPINIQDYTFDDFKELLTFIYSGRCSLNNDNIVALTDMAEFYGIKVLKQNCGELLPHMLNLNNVFQMLELAEKYSFENLKESVFKIILKSELSFNLKKSTVKEIVERTQNDKQEELFEGVYKWAENRALQKQKDDKSLNLNETIKEELCDILPLIKFEVMKYEFFVKFVVQKNFLFSGDQLSNILWARSKVCVKITDSNGKVMKGQLQCDEIEKVIGFIQSKKSEKCAYSEPQYCFWEGIQSPPTTPCKLTLNKNIDWYLAYDTREELSVFHQNSLDDYYDDGDDFYLLAELFPEPGFKLEADCKIEVFHDPY